jgi:hypothetical protein
MAEISIPLPSTIPNFTMYMNNYVVNKRAPLVASYNALVTILNEKIALLTIDNNFATDGMLDDIDLSFVAVPSRLEGTRNVIIEKAVKAYHDVGYTLLLNVCNEYEYNEFGERVPIGKKIYFNLTSVPPEIFY